LSPDNVAEIPWAARALPEGAFTTVMSWRIDPPPPIVDGRVYGGKDVEFQRFLKSMFLRIGQYRISKLLGIDWRHFMKARQRRQMTMNPDLRCGVGCQVQIGPAHLHHFL